MDKVIFVVGPTACGKSQVSISLAKTFNGEIISCDSMQIYKKLNIGTAKLNINQMENVPHHMLDIVPPMDRFSVGDYSKKSKAIMENIKANSKTVIFTGGTGLYVDSILYPYSFCNTAPNEGVRNDLNLNLKNNGPAWLYAELEKVDHITANRLHCNDTKRVMRALEVFYSTGNTLSSLNTEKISCVSGIIIGLNIEREVLYSQINHRVEQMFAQGLLQEVENLLSDGLDFEMQSMQAIGYKEFKLYFNDELNITEVEELIKKNTRNYAKRQITWFKKYNNIVWFDPSNIDDIVEYTKKQLKI